MSEKPKDPRSPWPKSGNSSTKLKATLTIQTDGKGGVWNLQSALLINLAFPPFVGPLYPDWSDTLRGC